MPRRVGQNVSLTPELAAFVAAQVASGRFGSVSEVVRAALRAFERTGLTEVADPNSGKSPTAR